MYLKIESDLHLEFSPHNPNLDNVNVYIIAGDTSQGTKGMLWALDLLDRYPLLHIIYISGNHEFYATNQTKYMEKVEIKLKEFSDNNDRIHYLQNDSVVLYGIRFIGSTLWTDFDHENPLAMLHVQTGINDFKCIRYNNGLSRFIPQKALQLHKKAKEYIFRAIEESEEPAVVVTHFCPYSLEHHKTSHLWSYFMVDLDKEIDQLNKPPLIWCSGHNHIHSDITFNYLNGKTRFIGNCKGYPSEQNTGFDNDFMVEI